MKQNDIFFHLQPKKSMKMATRKQKHLKRSIGGSTQCIIFSLGCSQEKENAMG